MSKICPKCGSIRIMKASEDVSICLACESFLNTINGKSKLIKGRWQPLGNAVPLLSGSGYSYLLQTMVKYSD